MSVTIYRLCVDGDMENEMHEHAQCCCGVAAFFSILHSWLNAFAEMLRFADRLFYKVRLTVRCVCYGCVVSLFQTTYSKAWAVLVVVSKMCGVRSWVSSG